MPDAAPFMPHYASPPLLVASLLAAFLNSILSLPQTVPIVSPIGSPLSDNDSTVYNVNADVAAGSVAEALGCEVTVFLTDVPGVLDADMELLPTLTTSDIEALKEEGVISGGMIPKVANALNAAKGGGRSVILDGRVEGALGKLMERMYGEGGGRGRGGQLSRFEAEGGRGGLGTLSK
jgi:acetylglutamate kinase